MSGLSIRAPWARSFIAAVVVAAGAVAVADPRPASGAPAPVTFTAVADARVQQNHPSSNYDNDPLRVEYSSTASVMSYVKFTTSGLTAPVQSAKLRLRAGSNGTSQAVAVNATGTGWTEKGLTWKTKPAKGTLLSTAPNLPASTWVEFDVTSAVTGNGTFAFVVSKVSGSDGADIKSREQTPNGPQLVVTAIDTPTTTATTTTTTSTTTTTTSTTTTTTSTTTTTAPTTTTTAPTTTTQPPPDPTPLPLPPTNTDWRAGNAFGGGYTNDVRFHPTDPNRVLIATDVAGIHLSTDGGTTWLPRGRAVNDHVASVIWSPNKSNVAYALAGSGDAGTGGVMVSTDAGVSWSMASTVPTGFSNNTPSSDGLPTPHPRSTGQLLAVDASGGFLYAGTYKQGLMRAPLDSNGRPGPWTTVALAPGSKPYFIRGIAIDDMDPSVVYVATYGSSASSGIGKVYRVSGAGGATPATAELTGGPRQAEELRTLGGHLYAVANDSSGAGVGAFRLADARTAPANSPWRRIAAGPSVTSVKYYGLEISKRNGTTTLWVSSDKAWRPDTTTPYKFLWRGTSTDDFATDGSWAALPRDNGDTPNDIAGPNNPPKPYWGINTDYGWPGIDPGYTASGISVSPADPNRLLIASQVSPWRTADNGETWYPVPTGIEILVQSRVTADPAEPSTVALGTVDFRGFTSTDGLRTSRYIGLDLRLAGLPGGSGEGWSVAFDQAASGPNRPVYYGTGDRGTNTLGEVWVDTDPSTTTGWTKLMSQSDSGGKRPIGLAVIRDPAAPDVPVTLAVLQNGQMLRKIGFDPGTMWLPASNFTSPMTSNTWPEAVEFVWKPGMTKVYVYDRVTGLWRSDDYGFSWTRIYSSPEKVLNKQGFIAADPANEDILYLATSAGVSVITNASTAGTDGAVRTPIPVPAGPPGPLAVGSDGRIYVATQPGNGFTAQIWGSRITAGGGISVAWQDLSDSLWDEAINDTREMAVGGNGALYVTLSGGVFVLDNPKVPG